MCSKCKSEALELLDHNRRLEHENTRLRGAVRRAICGHVFDEHRSCMLPRNHEGQHAWADAADAEVVLRWE